MKPPSQLEEIQADLKMVMASVATPVTIVTASADAAPFGSTVSAFTSLSMAPPMVLVALDRSSETLNVIEHTHAFGVNILAAQQAAAALHFAGKGGPAKFNGTPWTLCDGVPRLRDAPGWISCAVADLIDGGDHVIALGDVLAAELTEGAPLIYHSRRFGTHLAHPADGS